MKRPLLAPVVPFYAAGAALRWACLRPKRLVWPVISVGNLSAGGTGKTPFTIALAQLLTGQGFQVDVLSRGYGRADKAVERVDPEGSAARFGDEPLLIAREAGVPVFVGTRRFEAGELAEASLQQDSGIHLLDDGFQHRHLYRNLDIVLVNSEDLADHLLPAGNLREPLRALGRASIFAVPVDDDFAVARLRAMKLVQPVWRFRREMLVPEVQGPVAAFCGIARPAQFFAGLEARGLTLVSKKAFRDHHRFSARDMRTLALFADRSGAGGGLVTTEKDRVRIGDLASHLGQVPLQTAGLRVIFDDEAAVTDWLHARLKAGSP